MHETTIRRRPDLQPPRCGTAADRPAIHEA